MKVISYIRVSTDEQASSGLSLGVQANKTAAYAALYDLEIIEAIEDPGQSAKTLKRPGLQRALKLIDSGQADGLLIYKLDRLTRSVADWQHLIDKYFSEAGGKSLLSVSDSIDTRTAAGRLVLNVLLSVAQWEREAIGERTKQALSHRIDTGKRCGEVRFGYDLADDGETLIPNQDEQAVIALILSMRQAKQSWRKIATTLNQRQIPTKKTLGIWYHSTVKGVFDRANRDLQNQQ